MFRSNTAPALVPTPQGVTSKSDNNDNEDSFLFKLYQTIVSHPITVVSGNEGCGKTSSLCHLKENKFSTTSNNNNNTKLSSTSSSLSSGTPFESILHLCGTTLDSINPQKIARRLIVELCRLLKQQQKQLSAATTTMTASSTTASSSTTKVSSSSSALSFDKEIETLLSAASTAPDEHLGEITLQSLESFCSIQKKHFSEEKIDRNLVIFIDAIDMMFFPTKNKSNHGNIDSTTSLGDSPILQLFDLLPIQSENLFPRIRFVFSFTRSPSSSASATTAKTQYSNKVIAKVLERLSGGFDCLRQQPAGSSSSSATSSSAGVGTKSVSSTVAAGGSGHHACLTTFPLTLCKSSARKIISSQLHVLGKQWSKEMMDKAIESLPNTSEASGGGKSSLAYSFFETQDAERHRAALRKKQTGAATDDSNRSNLDDDQTLLNDELENQELLYAHFYFKSQKIPLPPRSALDASMTRAFFTAPTSGRLPPANSSSSSAQHAVRCGSPRFISVLIKELVASATFETLESTFSSILSQCHSVENLLHYIVERVGSSFGLDEVLSILSCLINTEIGLSEKEVSTISGVPLRTVVAVLGNSGIRDFFVDRAGVLKGNSALAEVFAKVCVRNNKDINQIQKMTQSGCVKLFLHLLQQQPKESLGRVCRELPLLLLSLRRPRSLARFLARSDVMVEMFVASKKDEFLSLWRDALALDPTISIDDQSWLFPISGSLAPRTPEDDTEDSKSPLVFFPSSFSQQSHGISSDKSSRKKAVAANFREASSGRMPNIFTDDHAEFYTVETIHPIADSHRIEVIILVSRLWGSFKANATAIEMLKNCVKAIKKNSAGQETTAVIQSTKTQLLQRLAQALIREGKFTEAVSIVQEALQSAVTEQLPGLLKVLGRGFRKLGDYNQALDCFERALKCIAASGSSGNNNSNNSSGLPMGNNKYSFVGGNNNSDSKKNGGDASLVINSKNALHTESTSAYFQKMDFDLASCLDEKADILRKLDRNTEALAILKKSLVLKQSSLSARHPAIASTLYSIAAAEKSSGNPSKAFTTVSESIAIIENFYGAESKRLFDPRFLQASCCVVLDHLPLSLILFQDLLEFAMNLFGPVKLETAETMQQLAQVYKKMGKARQAGEYLPKAYKMLQQVLEKEQHPKLVKILIQLADLQRKIGNNTAALQYAEEAVAMSKRLWEHEEELRVKRQCEEARLFGSGSKNNNNNKKDDDEENNNSPKSRRHDPNFDVQTAEAITSLASAKLKKASTEDELEEIAKMCQSALSVCQSRLGDHHIITASCLTVFGDVQRRMTNQLLNALEKYQQAFKIFEDAFGKTHVEVCDTLYKIGRCMKKMHWYAKAQRTYEDAINRMIEGDEQKKRGGSGGSSSASASTSAGPAAGASSSSSPGPSSTAAAQNIGPLNALLIQKQKQRKFKENNNNSNNNNPAQTLRRSAFQQQNRTEDDDDIMKHPKMAILQQSLGDTFRKQLEVDKARRLYEQALETNQFHYGQKHEEIAECLNGLAMCLYLDERYDEALEMESGVLRMTIELLGKENRHSKNRQRNLDMIMEKVVSPLEV